ncbi:MAG: PIN domain-containing protein [Armatimonadota bacterium]|nr:PIN domain-containing protein [bacterium]MDW8320998.1 PIN domain-containing protein [Armatimonadota bacterium]
MTCVVDTHALVWLLEDSPQISSVAIQALSDANTTVVVPTIVLAEIAFLYSKKPSSGWLATALWHR